MIPKVFAIMRCQYITGKQWLKSFWNRCRVRRHCLFLLKKNMLCHAYVGGDNHDSRGGVILM